MNGLGTLLVEEKEAEAVRTLQRKIDATLEEFVATIPPDTPWGLALAFLANAITETVGVPVVVVYTPGGPAAYAVPKAPEPKRIVVPGRSP